MCGADDHETADIAGSLVIFCPRAPQDKAWGIPTYDALTYTKPRTTSPSGPFQEALDLAFRQAAKDMERRLYEETAWVMGVRPDSDLHYSNPSQAYVELVFGVGPDKPKLGLQALIGGAELKVMQRRVAGGFRITDITEA